MHAVQDGNMENTEDYTREIKILLLKLPLQTFHFMLGTFLSMHIQIHTQTCDHMCDF